MSILQLEQVTRSVDLADGTRLDILRGIDLEVDAGDHVSIVGRSGSGKSTLLNLLGLIDTPTSGYMPPETVEALGKGPVFPRRLGRPDEFAHMVEAIVENTYMNGETVRLDAAIRMPPK